MVAIGGRVRAPRTTATAAAASAGSSPAHALIARGAMVCFCEDVCAHEIDVERVAGYDDPELVKRRTGALTGPCQGKYCLQAFACLVAGGDPVDAGGPLGSQVDLPTARPPLRPVRLRDLVPETAVPETPVDSLLSR